MQYPMYNYAAQMPAKAAQRVAKELIKFGSTITPNTKHPPRAPQSSVKKSRRK